MAAVGIETAPGLQQLFKDISPKFKPVESESIVKTLKENYGGKFDLLDSHDLMKCFQLLEEHGYVSDNKLSLIEDFAATKSDQEKLIKEYIDRFKASRLGKGDPEKELQGRSEEIKIINKKLESKDTVVLNLFGSSGVGKKKLAIEVCSQWQGKYHFFDLREAKDMKAIYYNMLHSLELVIPVGRVDQNYVVTKVIEKVEEFKGKEHAVLFMLGNVDLFTAGKGNEGKNLKTAFMEFLAKLSESKGERSPLKLLLTSRTELRGPKRMDDFEVGSLEETSSEKLIFPKGMTDVKPEQKDNLMSITKGFPLFLRGLGAIMRQERKSPEELIAEVVHAPKKMKVEEDASGKLAGFDEEGVNVNQMSAVSLMFETLSTERLKLSAVVVSLFHGPFSVATAAKVLDIDPSEAIVQLEGLVASEIISVVDEEAKERKYDIHPLLWKYADSIKNHKNFLAPYMEAKARFYKHFMSRMEKISKLIEPEYVRAFHLFEKDRGNYEFTIEISLQPEYFVVQSEFHDNALLASLFTAMLTDKKIIKVFHSWAEMCEDDGKSGSLFRAQLKSWEAREVSDVDGTERGFETLREALNSLEKVEDQSSESFMLTKGLYLRTEGEILWRNRDYKKALASLELSLTFSEPLLKEHTDLARCYNAIGNSFFHLDQPRKALEFYKKAYKMQEKLASENHFDVPMYKNQIGTAYEGLKDYEKAVQWYRDALSLLEDLKLLGDLDEALFLRNLANALMFQDKYKEAIEPSERAYNIRMKLLGNHPQTVRSIFQRGVLQANLKDPKKALKLFLEAWEMEKSLGVGNHSEVWRKIITGVEDMCGWTLSFLRMRSFRKEAFKFCQRFWEEQKASQQFSFNMFNKGIVDALNDLADDRKEKAVVQKEQFWFYEARCNANEEEFQEDFDLKTDNDALCVMLSERENLLNEIVELSSRLKECEKVKKYKMDKVALYKMCLVRADFLGNKEDRLDKASLKMKVENLYKETGQEGMIVKFRETLLDLWQKQWEEGKVNEKTEKIGLKRERTIEGILNLCLKLKKVNLYRWYGQEALSFYEEIWEIKHAEMKDREMKKFLRKLKELASSIEDYTSEKFYINVLQALNETGRHPGAKLRRRVAQTSPTPKEEEKVSEEEELVIEIGSEEESEVGAEERVDTDKDVQTEDRTKFLPLRVAASLPGVDAGDVSDLDRRSMKQRAGFLACMCQDVLPERYLLKLFCFPLRLKSKVNMDIAELNYDVIFQGDGNSKKPLFNEDEMSVSLSKGLKVHEGGDTGNLSLTFYDDGEDQGHVYVTIEDKSNMSVDFLKLLNAEDRTDAELLCTVPIIIRGSPSQDPYLSSQFYPRTTLPRKPEMIASSNITDTSQSERGTRVNSRGSGSKLKVSLLASEWSSSMGGLSTINRNLAIQLGRHAQVEVTLIVPPSSCSEEEKSFALSLNVDIKEVQSRKDNSDPLDWLKNPPKDLEIDVVVGHGQKLGEQVPFITESHGCKSIQVVHTSPEDLGMYKNYSKAIPKGEKKKTIEVKLCKQADAVVAIGPTLKETFSAYLRSCGKQEDIIELTPGIFSEFSTIKHAAVDNKNFRVLIFGRSDREDLEVKGYDIASKAIAELSDTTYRLIFVGAPDGKEEEIKDYLLQNGIPDDQLTVRKFVQSKEELEELFCEMDLCIMPSRVEGFGLTALEAMSAGLPILVSGYSGFGEALCAMPSGKKVVVKSKDPKVWAEAIAGVRQKERSQRLQEIKQIRRSYEEKYDWEKQCEILVKKMWDISSVAGN